MRCLRLCRSHSLQPFSRRAPTHGDAATGGVAQGVGDQVRQHFTNPHGIDIEQWQIIRSLHAQSNRTRVGIRTERVAASLINTRDQLTHDATSTCRFRQATTCGDHLSNARERASLLKSARDVLRRRDRCRRVNLQGCLNDGERRAKFVRHVSQQVAALLFIRLQTFRHRIKRSRQPAQFARALARAPAWCNRPAPPAPPRQSNHLTEKR